ncbi:AMP-dependent synthetase/ligase [Penicillium expansum]|uniref:Acyl-CoA ligase cnsG n=1 Tax=Penicillium expansum TaxID=27334 RepID=CNSG_PENEN|nr:AMP-dependent synthetase/ligase [Penicillium expansum]A0A0A2J5U8.1 RecName: Full=Acyl-CoA ligase cnsG; AltName: Full=Communesin biosynthesis cluster protein G [Penicillium expansum]KGO40476.1 AMP-dependent synthetase/ligase [Penicillium expansum]KGO50068.1 AMP-dependent synthetase/ligase [Penicillium expansum]KGO59700.1 AMP-dependent synthetase/ligase [Penicillium expansum]
MESPQLPPSMKRPAIVYGDKTPTILETTLGHLLDELSDIHRDKAAVEFPWQSIRRTYSELAKTSKLVAISLLSAGLCHGDRIGILTGNRYEFLDVFLAAARIGCPAVILQSNMSPGEMKAAVLKSGTTGNPKAAVLTHRNVVNNSHFFSRACDFEQSDIICSPLPLCHSFGLVSAFLCSFMRGCLILFPTEKFSADAVVDVLQNRDVTVIYGVPTMFFAVLEKLQGRGHKPRSMVKAIAGGAPVPYALITQICQDMGVQYFLNGYGMTETSPATFISPLGLCSESSLRTIGKVLPHTNARIVDRWGRTVQQGEKGELCISGLPLQKGYWEDEEKTSEIMTRDADGVIWLHTGDEAIIGEDDHCTITGRIKDIIIRGGLNISPVEIEERLILHPFIQEASVVGLPDKTRGEIVGCFLKQYVDMQRPSDEAVRAWVRELLGWHKAPEAIFWIGDAGIGEDFPKTASGKHQKEKLKDIGTYLLA